jgi:hypothetical protein
MRFLQQSTSVIVTLGPFVDATDGFTAETALSPSATNVQIYKAGATAAVDIYNATWTHIGLGVYRVTLTASHTDTCGPLHLMAHISGARPVIADFHVAPATTYAMLVSGSALPADLTAIVGNGTAATLMAFPALTIQNFTVGSGSTTTRIATDLTENVSDHWNGRTVIFFTGTLAKQACTISDYNGSTKELTVSQLTTAPAAGDTAVIV